VFRFLPEARERREITRPANHSIMLGGGSKLARRSIEQHAYIPYTHG